MLSHKKQGCAGLWVGDTPGRTTYPTPQAALLGPPSSLTPCYPGSALSPKGCLSVLEGDRVWGVPWRSPEKGLAPAPVLSYGAGRTDKSDLMGQGGPLDTVPNPHQLGRDTAAPQMGSWARMFQSTRYW